MADRFGLTLLQSYDLNESQLSQRRALLGQKYFTGNIPLLTTMIVIRNVVVLRCSPLPQLMINVVEEQAREGGRAGTLRPENSLGVSSPCLPQPQFIINVVEELAREGGQERYVQKTH